MRNNTLSEVTNAVQITNYTVTKNGILFVMYIALLVVVFVDNTLVIMIVITSKQFRRPPDVFITSLAVSDLLMSLGPIPMASIFAYHGYWPSEYTGLCNFWIGSFVFLGSASMYNLASMSVDRLIACTRPIRYRTTSMKARVMLLITISWIIPFILILTSLVKGTASVSEGGKCFGRLELRIRASNTLFGFVITCTVVTGSSLCIIRVLQTRNHGSITSRHNATSVSSDLVQCRVPSAPIHSTCIQQLSTSRKTSNSTLFQLSLERGGYSHFTHLTPRLQSLAFHFSLSLSTRKYVSRMRIPMIRELMEIYFSQHIPQSGKGKKCNIIFYLKFKLEDSRGQMLI
ncbi:hypothetical protein FGIG_03894 [Fasciola gigantica]|uniref:G-protein coupled receptors family 1 profile domain-containing protein n=1 Tax=Fasciola gigantica TaxID=46835 RepID=A0A504YEN9_FASGI|nr:hypothetical protein FGIG_03894 [Fasciola gigantica]